MGGGGGLAFGGGGGGLAFGGGGGVLRLVVRFELRDIKVYSVDPALRDTTIHRTQVREIYSSVKRRQFS